LILDPLYILQPASAAKVYPLVSDLAPLLQSYVVGLASRLISLAPVGIGSELRPMLSKLLLSLLLISHKLKLMAHLELLVERDTPLLDCWPLLHFIELLRSCFSISELVVRLRRVQHFLDILFQCAGLPLRDRYRTLTDLRQDLVPDLRCGLVGL